MPTDIMRAAAAVIGSLITLTGSYVGIFFCRFEKAIKLQSKENKFLKRCPSSMEWWLLVTAAILWAVGIGILLNGLCLTKENHEKKSLLEHSSRFPTLADFSLFGFIFDAVTSLLYGVIMKYSPWWLAKAFLILISFLFFYWGALAIIKFLHRDANVN